MTNEQASSFVLENDWTEKQSSIGIPYWFLEKQNSTSTVLFEQFIAYIKSNGQEESHYARPFKYCNIGDYKYWTISSDVKETKIINRALI